MLHQGIGISQPAFKVAAGVGGCIMCVASPRSPPLLPRAGMPHPYLQFLVYAVPSLPTTPATEGGACRQEPPSVSAKDVVQTLSRGIEAERVW